jgi:hypothetical protein
VVDKILDMTTQVPIYSYVRISQQLRLVGVDEEYRKWTLAGVAPMQTRDVTKAHVAQRIRLELMNPVADEVDRVLNVLNSLWKPPP